MSELSNTRKLESTSRPDDLEKAFHVGIGTDHTEPAAVSKPPDPRKQHREAAAVDVRHLAKVDENVVIADIEGLVQSCLQGSTATVIDLPSASRRGAPLMLLTVTSISLVSSPSSVFRRSDVIPCRVAANSMHLPPSSQRKRPPAQYPATSLH